MDTRIKLSRRDWLRTTAAVAGTAAIVPASALGRTARRAPSERINIGMIGCGKMANDYHLSTLLRQDDVQIVGVAEVDRTRREHAQKRVADAYAEQSDVGACTAFTDYREMIDREDLDAVCIATPDHWHAIPIIDACKAGLDVYCEKPLTLTIAEAKACVDAVRRHERVFQTGSQQRSNVFGPFREAVEIIRSGRLGTIERVTVGVGDPAIPCDLPAEDLEPGLDWNLWLGQAPDRPYHSILSPRGVHNHFPAWRRYHEYSGGGHTDMGAHHYDIAQWALDMDRSGPVKIIPPDEPDARRGVKYVYANGVEMEHGGPGGCTFYGSEGELRIDRGHLSSTPVGIVDEPLGESDVQLFRSPGHHRNWLDCIRSRERPVADVEAGARTVTIVHLGNIAYQTGRVMEWDPDSWSYLDEADNQFCDRERREGFQLPSID